MSGICANGASCNCYYNSGYKCNRIMNAIELTWILPYDIPSDSTKATVSCKDSDPNNNYITFYQSSLVT